MQTRIFIMSSQRALSFVMNTCSISQAMFILCYTVTACRFPPVLCRILTLLVRPPILSIMISPSDATVKQGGQSDHTIRRATSNILK
jgi:hypothetical protein